jgi:hypothetical protein
MKTDKVIKIKVEISINSGLNLRTQLIEIADSLADKISDGTQSDSDDSDDGSAWTWKYSYTTQSIN